MFPKNVLLGKYTQNTIFSMVGMLPNILLRPSFSCRSLLNVSFSKMYSWGDILQHIVSLLSYMPLTISCDISVHSFFDDLNIKKIYIIMYNEY